MPQRISGVYLLGNHVTGDYYIGSSVNIAHRKHQHFDSLARGSHICTRLQRSYNKHGKDAFELWIIEEVPPDKDLLLQREQYWIDTLHPAYNSRPIAASNLGIKYSEETRQKMSAVARSRPPEALKEFQRKGAEKSRGRKVPEDTIRKRVETRRGYTHSEEIKRKISETNKRTRANWTDEQRRTYSVKSSEGHTGIKQTEESRRKKSEALKGRTFSEESLKKMSASQKTLWQNKTISEEEHRNRSEEVKAGWARMSEEKRARMIAKKQAHKASDETRRRMSESTVEQWKKRRIESLQAVSIINLKELASYAQAEVAFRLRIGMSQTELAELVGISISYINIIEKGKTKPPRLDKVVATIKALHLNREEATTLLQLANPEYDAAGILIDLYG